MGGGDGRGERCWRAVLVLGCRRVVVLEGGGGGSGRSRVEGRSRCAGGSRGESRGVARTRRVIVVPTSARLIRVINLSFGRVGAGVAVGRGEGLLWGWWLLLLPRALVEVGRLILLVRRRVLQLPSGVDWVLIGRLLLVRRVGDRKSVV